MNLSAIARRMGEPNVSGSPYYRGRRGYRAIESLAPEPPDAYELRMVQQARLYTFLPYRRGLARTFDRAPYDTEEALHAYLRVLILWLKYWPGLGCLVDLESEGPADRDPYAAFGLGLPAIALDDLGALLDAHQRRVTGRTDPAGVGIGRDVLVSGLRSAVVAQRRDPVVSALTAYNHIRDAANSRLGGALARADLHPRLMLDVDAEVVEAVTRWGTLDGEARDAFLQRHPFWAVVLRPQGGGEGRDG